MKFKFMLNENNLCTITLKEDLNRTFIETPQFRRSWKELKLTDDDLQDLQNLILTHSEIADSYGNDLYKIRFSPKSLKKGKNTADRVMYVNLILDEEIYLIHVFSKSDEANLSSEEEKLIYKLAQEVHK